MMLSNLSLWLCNYLVHSTALMLLVLVVEGLGLLQQRRVAEQSWRLALFAGIITASVQMGFSIINTSNPLPRAVVTSTTAKIHLDDTPTAKRPTESSMRPGTSTSIATPIKAAPLEKQASIAPVEHQSTYKSKLELPFSSRTKDWLETFALIWLVYAVWILIRASVHVAQLHQQLRRLPTAASAIVDHSLRQSILHVGISLSQIRMGDIWNSPFAAPNGDIYLPQGTLQKLDQQQVLAILKHEQRHLQRQDQYWQIAIQITKSIFFFQVLNRTATNKLSLLAEIDCDHFASSTPAARTNFSETLLLCAEINTHSKLPNIAVAMAMQSALLRRINLLLDDKAMNTLFKKQNKISSWLPVTSLVAACFLIASYLPNVVYATSTPDKASTRQDSFLPAIEHNALNPKVEMDPLLGNETARPISETSQEGNQMPKVTEDKILPAANTNDLEKHGAEPVSIQTQSDRNINSVELADKAYAEKDFRLALEVYLAAAKQGNVHAQAMVGEMLWYGDGTNADASASKTWFEKAATQGHVRAQAFFQMIREREQYKEQIAFYTQAYDGSNLRWDEKTCPLPRIDKKEHRLNDYMQIAKQIETSIACRNNYLTEVKRQHKNNAIIPSHLQRIMTAAELNQANALIHQVLIQNLQDSKKEALTAVEALRDWNDKFQNQLSLRAWNQYLDLYFRDSLGREQTGYSPYVLLTPSDVGQGGSTQTSMPGSGPVTTPINNTGLPQK